MSYTDTYNSNDVHSQLKSYFKLTNRMDASWEYDKMCCTRLHMNKMNSHKLNRGKMKQQHHYSIDMSYRSLKDELLKFRCRMATMSTPKSALLYSNVIFVVTEFLLSISNFEFTIRHLFGRCHRYYSFCPLHLFFVIFSFFKFEWKRSTSMSNDQNGKKRRNKMTAILYLWYRKSVYFNGISSYWLDWIGKCNAKMNFEWWVCQQTNRIIFQHIYGIQRILFFPSHSLVDFFLLICVSFKLNDQSLQ